MYPLHELLHDVIPSNSIDAVSPTRKPHVRVRLSEGHEGHTPPVSRHQARVAHGLWRAASIIHHSRHNRLDLAFDTQLRAKDWCPKTPESPGRSHALP
eukprot:7384818-Prymnesium_polylepis.1